MSHRISRIRRVGPALMVLLLVSYAEAHPEGDILPESVAVLEYRLVLSLNPEDNNTRNKLGIVFYRLGELEKAAQTFSETLRLDSRNADALDGLGLVALKKGERVAAEEYFRRAIVLKEDDAMNHYHLGHLLQAKGAVKEAETEFLRSVALRAHGLNLQALARLYRSENRRDEARMADERASDFPLTDEDRKNELK